MLIEELTFKLLTCFNLLQASYSLLISHLLDTMIKNSLSLATMNQSQPPQHSIQINQFLQILLGLVSFSPKRSFSYQNLHGLIFEEILNVFSLLKIVFTLHRANFSLTPIFVEKVSCYGSTRGVQG